MKKQRHRSKCMEHVPVHITQKMYKRFQDVLLVSNRSTMSGLVRAILEGKSIRTKHYDRALDRLLPDLIAIESKLQVSRVAVDRMAAEFCLTNDPKEILAQMKAVTSLCIEAQEHAALFFNLFSKILLKWLPK